MLLEGFALADRIAQALGVPIIRDTNYSHDTYYDGQHAHICAANTESVLFNYFHELGHYFVATPAERSLPEYGLGFGPGYPPTLDDIHPVSIGVRAVPKPVSEYCDTVESQASLVGILFTFAAGGQAWKDHADEHNWRNDLPMPDHPLKLCDPKQHDAEQILSACALAEAFVAKILVKK